MRAGDAHANLNFAHGAKRVGGIAEIIRTDGRQQFARFWPHHAQNRFRRRHIRNHHKRIPNMAAQPGQIALHCGPRHHRKIGSFRQPGYCKIALYPTVFVQHLGIDHTTRRHVQLIGANLVQKRRCIPPFHPDFPERRHIKQPNTAAHCHMFGFLVVKPVLPRPGILILCRLPRIGEPIGALPPGGFAKHRTARLQMIVQRRSAHPARGGKLAVREVIGIEQAKRFADPFLQIFAVALKGLRAPDINFPQIKRRFAFCYPMRQGIARPTRRRDANRIIPCRNPVAAQFRRFAQIIAIIGCETFRTVEKRMNARRLKQRQAVHCMFKNGLEMVPVFGQRIKAEIFADTRHPPRL